MSESERENLSAKECKALDDFRARLADAIKPEHDDWYLLRWLRARRFDVSKAEIMLRKSLKWREEWRVDTILEEWSPPEVLLRYQPGGVCGTDKEGCPVYIFPSSGLDTKGLIMSAKRMDIHRFHISISEMLIRLMKEQSKMLGKRVDKMVIIEDMENFGMKQWLQPGMDVLFDYFAQMEANYPEIMKTTYIINAPKVFPIIYKLVKPLINEDTRRKIKVLGGNWREVLRKDLDPAQLPKHYGGDMVGPDGDDRCQHVVPMASTVPESCYLQGQIPTGLNEVVKKVTISGGKTFKHEVIIDTPGQVLRWVFWTENHDLKYSVLYEVDEKNLEVVSPEVKVNCDKVPEDGVIACERSGKYILKFDNTHSWYHSKQLSYIVEVPGMNTVDNTISNETAVRL